MNDIIFNEKKEFSVVRAVHIRPYKNELFRILKLHLSKLMKNAIDREILSTKT